MRSLLLIPLFHPLLTLALNITLPQPNTPFAPSPLPPSHAQSDGEKIVSLFQTLGRTTTWKLVSQTPFQGDTYEPEGIVRLGPDRYIVSAGEYTIPTIPYGKVINGTDRTAGAGFAHLIVFSGNGTRIADVTLTKPGELEYHNGGIDFDGEAIWCTIAQYRPNTTAHVVRVDPRTLQQQTILRYNDHLGGIVHDVQKGSITTLNWGARNASTFDLGRRPGGYGWNQGYARAASVVRNPSYFVDYQDCKFLGHSRLYNGRAVMLCSGVATIGSGASSYNLGGVAIVDVETMVPLMEVPITMRSILGTPVTQNPVEVSVEDGKLRLYFLPDQHTSILYVYEAQPDSPYEF
ncbi:hypothetical protein PRZ48_010580 [Zasmidium cellare]|uniref:Uncharacterized protein n=1 Tax=Zasmidium cellare TaxID=395010 RepID=A0ABR0E970_ZASCE|nr:hypothetical protein PRZ48_010580 [Zasmidium cellare]